MSYTPSAPPRLDTLESQRIFQWLERELIAISRNEAEELDSLWFRILYVAPEKPRAGLVVYADGTTWNPGSGEGLYRYSLGATWVHLG